MNKFQAEQTGRQIKFKRKAFPGLRNGSCGRKSYPYILPKDLNEKSLERVFYAKLAKEIVQYCHDNNIAFHSAALNLRSSQVCCFNIMFYLSLNLDSASKVLASFLPGLERITKIDFEFIGRGGDTLGWIKWSGEPPGSKAGMNRTSVDVAIEWKKCGIDKPALTLIEWKYTEPSYGSCGGYHSKGNGKKKNCLEFDVKLGSNYEKLCYLIYKEGRKYWEHLEKAGINLKLLPESFMGCPFRGPFYQLLRQYLFAGFLKNTGKFSEVDVKLISFRGNDYFERSPRDYKVLDKNIIKAWNKLLSGAPKLEQFYVEDIVESMRRSNVDKNILNYLEERYGL